MTATTRATELAQAAAAAAQDKLAEDVVGLDVSGQLGRSGGGGHWSVLT